jgi:hypothetical protein
MTARDRPASSESYFLETASSFTPDTQAADIDLLLGEMEAANLAALQLRRVLDEIKRCTKIPVGELARALRDIRRESRGREIDSRRRRENGPDRPELTVWASDLPATARALRDLFAGSGNLFDRDMPVKVVQPADGGPMMAIPLTVNSVVVEAHRLCQPIEINSEDRQILVTLPDRVAKMYLDMVGEWNLPPLAGISTAPLLAADGTIHCTIGYDRATGLWCCKVPALSVPERPGLEDARAALRLLRQAFRTFPFADAARKYDPVLRVEIVDPEVPPGRDESAFLAALLTAISRPSLWLAPGFLVIAPQISGAGTGKGLLVRAICIIAFGLRARAFTAGHDRQELEKRIAAELVEAGPALFLDNVNGAVLRSETLASVLTERPARVRVLGETRMVRLNCSAFVAVTGNGLSISEDLARRFLVGEIDARCEDPEARPFAAGFLDEIEHQRAELLSAALTIWRFGRQNESALERGRPLGSYETWCEWVRDPLLTLGCRDPVERIEAIKARDPLRQKTAELFSSWYRHHRDAPVKAADIAEPVRHLIDPQNRGRQYVATCLGRLVGTRAAGYLLTRQEAVGAWGAATYALVRTDAENDGGIGHRDHRDHREHGAAPMPPMPDAVDAGLDENFFEIAPETEAVL